jgi:hypothetical protein
MAAGEFEKLKIIAYSDPDFADSHQVGEPFEALINPESYTLETRMEFSDQQGSGTSGSQPKFAMKPPEELAFEFLFDNTGIIDGNPREDISEDLQNFKDFLMKYEGDIHSPKLFKFVWGTSLMKGICTALNINYKLFNPDGKPIRAICKVTIRELKEEELRVIEENNQSPDLTHYRLIKKGDTLPLLCYSIYGDSKYYIQVARVNKLNNFRNLQAGDQIFFPPISNDTDK